MDIFLQALRKGDVGLNAASISLLQILFTFCSTISLNITVS